jgi:hypothetical protein
VRYYEHEACYDHDNPLRAMGWRLHETRQWLALSHQHRNALERRLWEAEHVAHGAWRGWRITRWAAHRGYALGVIAGSTWESNSACRGCITHVSWRGERVYIAGWSREQWRCLIIGRHRRREIPGSRLCAVCAPCPTCRSTDPHHDAWRCELAAERLRMVDAAIAARGDQVVRVSVDRGPEGMTDTDGIRTACDGLVVTAGFDYEASRWRLTHVGTGRGLRSDVWFPTADAALAQAERFAASGLDFTTDPRQWPAPDVARFKAVLDDLRDSRGLVPAAVAAADPAVTDGGMEVRG